VRGHGCWLREEGFSLGDPAVCSGLGLTKRYYPLAACGTVGGQKQILGYCCPCGFMPTVLKVGRVGGLEIPYKEYFKIGAHRDNDWPTGFILQHLFSRSANKAQHKEMWLLGRCRLVAGEEQPL
jgi:hypothetical protein